MLEGMNRKYNVSGLVAGIVIVAFGFLLLKVLNDVMPFGQDKMVVAKEYIKMGTDSTGAQNLVTSVVLSFRALDTLGEVTVLFASSMAVGMLFLPGVGLWRKRENFLLWFASRCLPYIVVLIGIYIVSQGHLSPGGGFQGGVVIASGLMLWFLLAERRRLSESLVHFLESLMGAGFVAVGLVGLIKYGSFLYNFLPKGRVGTLFSAGILPILYAFIGIKVAMEFVAIIDRFTSRLEDKDV